MTCVNATKTKLYKLVSEYIYLPQMKEIKYIEASDRSGVYLKWSVANDICYSACYSIKYGIPSIVIQIKRGNETHFENIIVRDLDINSLESKGMIKHIKRESLIKNILSKQAI